MSSSGQAENDYFFFACFCSFFCFIDIRSYRVTAFWCWKNTFRSCKKLRCFKYRSLSDRYSFPIAILVKLRKNRNHDVIPKSSCMVWRRYKSASESVHLGERANHAGITEIVCELLPRVKLGQESASFVSRNSSFTRRKTARLFSSVRLSASSSPRSRRGSAPLKRISSLLSLSESVKRASLCHAPTTIYTTRWDLHENRHLINISA